ncbi:histidine kinase [Streptomyces thioluteus]|uniref:histidine kinase n=1 Tax=Streptomyces thioluteus TaxID=66431 RepID=UPI003CD07588
MGPRTRLTEQQELTAEERARRTLLEERGRIARELHDVVAHHMSVVSIQAQVVPHLVENPSRSCGRISPPSAGAPSRHYRTPPRPGRPARSGRPVRGAAAHPRPNSTTWSPRCAAPESPSPPPPPAPYGRSRPASNCPPTASSRKP